MTTPMSMTSTAKRNSPVTDFSALDNAAWFALTTVHQPLARSNGLARRYPSTVSPIVGLRDGSPAAFADLRELTGPGESVALAMANPLTVPSGWLVIMNFPLEQMICTQTPETWPVDLMELSPADAPEMLALATATEPGPFLLETIRMGRYFGVRSSDGRLAAMAGQRLQLEQFTEISAVCTDPAFRGLGHAKALVSFLAKQILSDGRVPFLHVRPDNLPAKKVYEKLGFRVRRVVQLMVLARQD